MWKIIQVFPGIWHPFCYSDSEALCAPCRCPSMLHVQEWIYALSAALRAGSDLLCAFSCWRSIVTIDAVESVHPQMLQKHQKAPVHHRMSLNIRTFIWNIEEAGSFFFSGTSRKYEWILFGALAVCLCDLRVSISRWFSCCICHRSID